MCRICSRLDDTNDICEACVFLGWMPDATFQSNGRSAGAQEKCECKLNFIPGFCAKCDIERTKSCNFHFIQETGNEEHAEYCRKRTQCERK